MKEDLRWAPVIPLIGGLALGAARATGRKPDGIYSYEAFADNDQHLVGYWRDVPYELWDATRRAGRHVDLAVICPPCAGLSLLNNARTPEMRGVDATKNEWMYRSAADTMEELSPTVIVGENAPGLYTERGRPVRDRMYRVARDHGYSLGFVRTDTALHGLPQHRHRTHYFFWKGDRAPLVGYVERPMPTLRSWLRDVPDDAPQQDVVINENVLDEPYWQFLVERYGGSTRTVRDAMAQHGVYTANALIGKLGVRDDVYAWVEKTGNEKWIRKVDRHRLKFEDDKGIWDGSVHSYRDAFNAVINRNMADSIHPVHDRGITLREAMHLMGMPMDFELIGGRGNFNHISQNVPVFTAADMVTEALRFIDGELELTDQSLVMQDNVRKRFDNPEGRPASTLEEAFQ